MSDLLTRLVGCLEPDLPQDVRVDPAGRVIHADDAGRRCGYSYDDRGDLVALDDPEVGRTEYCYDGERRLSLVRHPRGRVTGYRYDERDRLVQVTDAGHRIAADFDDADRVVALRHDDELLSTYRYDERGRVVAAAAAGVRTRHGYDDEGRVVRVEQVIDGIPVVVELDYDRHGRLATVAPAGGPRMGYRWDDAGRPAAMTVDGRSVVEFDYRDDQRLVRTRLGNGVIEQAQADPVDGRPLERSVRRDGVELMRRHYRYDGAGRIVDDGRRSYGYDEHARLCAVRDDRGRWWSYGYDPAGNLNRVETCTAGLAMTFDGDRLVTIRGERHGATYDARGALTGVSDGSRSWAWRYDAAGRLVQVRRDAEVLARLRYDHKGRMVVADWRSPDPSGPTRCVERYVYGPGDELLAVTDLAGLPIRVPLRSPWAVHAEVIAGPGRWNMRYLHHDDRGTLWLASGEHGEVIAEYDYDAFGCPPQVPAVADQGRDAPAPVFGGRPLVPGAGLYYYGARWYHPRLRRFLTADSWTAGPDDQRLVHPALPGRRQPVARAEQLPDWSRRPRLRDAYAFCGNDPVNRLDPNGHWSFGAVVLSLLGAVWTLPNTLAGLALEISCLAGEVVRWLAWVVTLGHVSWETPGFDVAASGRLNAFALVFRGGWLGSFSSLLGITFGNVFFVNGRWDERPEFSRPGDVLPVAYHGKVRLPRAKSLYEHELRHTNQYGWLGPFFHLGLPIFGFYEWDVILHGYQDAWTERDARDHADGPDAPTEVVARDATAGGGVSAPSLSSRWVYWRAAGTTTVLRAGSDGALRAAAVPGSTRPWEYTATFTAAVGDLVDVTTSSGARPLPAALLGTPGLLVAATVTSGPGGRARIDIAARAPSLTLPTELGCWPLPHDLPADGYPLTGLPQQGALWTTPAGGNDGLTVVEGSPAPDPGAARPGHRGLRVRGDVDPAATAVRVRLLDSAGNAVALTPDVAGQPRAEVAAILATPSGGRRSFEAVLEPSDPVTAFGQVQLGLLADTPTGPIVDAFTGHLCGLQLSLVDDPAAGQPGPELGEGDEVIVVDFDTSPQDTAARLADQARARRMVRYRIANETRPAAAGGVPVLRPRMPLWMGELQFVGLGRTDIEDLLHRRADRRGTPSGAPAGPLTSRISFHWRLRLSWDGPDAGGVAFAAPFPRPNQRHAYTLDVPPQPALVTAVLSYDERGRLTDASGSTAPADPGGALPGALQPPPTPLPYPVAGRRPPAVRVGQLRRWGRAVGAASLPSLIIEFQPAVQGASGELIRGGDGVLAVDDVLLDGSPVGAALAAPAAPRPAGSPLLRLPPFRVYGQNPPVAQVEDVVRRLVGQYVTAHAAAPHIAPLTQDCWAETVLRILRHESGARYRQFDERGAGRRRFGRLGGTWWFGSENGMPLFGPPHGYGIGQLDLFSSPQRGANDDEVWNWVENLRAAAMVVLADKAVAAWTLIGQHAPALLDHFTRAVFQRETVRRYNGGTEFAWTGATWAVRPSVQWVDNADHGKGPSPNVQYPNLVLGTGLVYYTSGSGQPNVPDGANTQFGYPPPMTFGAADYGPGTGP